MEQTPEQVMRSALDAFGEQSQVDMVLEEGFELGKALLKLRRKKGTVEDVIDEIADGFVTLGQMRLLYGPEAVDARIKVKLARLVRLVADQVALNAEKAKAVAPQLPDPCAEFGAWRTDDTPATKPVKPVLRWEDEGGARVLRLGDKQIGIVESQKSGYWTGDPSGKAMDIFAKRDDAMRYVERMHRMPEVPLWTP